MIDILKRIFIGVAIGMSIFFLKSNFGYALTYDLKLKDEFFVFDYGKRLNIIIGNSSSITDNNSLHTSTATFDYKYNNSSGYEFAVFPIASITLNNINGSNISNVLSDITFKIQLIPDDGAWSTCELQNNFIVCPINPNLNYSSLVFSYTRVTTAPDASITIVLNNTVQLYNGTISSIASSTEETLNETKKITDTTDNSGNGNTYDNSGVSSNNNKEESLTDGADDLFDNFDVDLSSNSNAFQFIFQLMTRFVKANSKIFGVFLSILSFGFIKLVLGR